MSLLLDQDSPLRTSSPGQPPALRTPTGLQFPTASIGEETGKIPPLLDFIAKTYEDEFQMRLEMFEQLITPTLMMFCGTIVGIWAVATLLPMGELISNLAAG